MQKIDWKKLEDTNGQVHWVNPQQVSRVRAFNGDIMISFSDGSPILCRGDGRDSFGLIQLMLDYLSDADAEDTRHDDTTGMFDINMLRAER